jgi:RNA polymerase sigma-70 factor, ECF subfamily
MQDRPFPFSSRVDSMAGVLTVPDEHAFAAIVESHRDELDRHCARLLRSPADAEDALQETFLRAWRSLHTCRASPRPWLYRIATNVCFDLLAARRTAPMTVARVPEAVAPSELQPDAVVIAGETVELALLTALRHLPARQHACLVMRDVLRWSAKDTASTLSLSVAAANSAVQRARGGLREHLAADRLDWARAT